ncbi:MAG: photosystem I reaction center subunit XII [Aphanocapsa feldmannii 277cV]|uniref:Photosystem I reaction center subunit XII n=2 Tax=Aphanocapsa feldmannii TaxID=192050 RepID=A0A524RMT4_9CHRO|nr:MAG: photosystem I reaction center subunit XII [Aphanocapsa feldmannii 288cV]TGG91003.1 MAG: photosystem I reaction center subunit XII [Aphanocapsa feldmannii 277cV]TGH21937.1 MAG: photosystem I reaction center subunit XII [Aphanocapsa feldmannii 277cI]
MRLFKVRACIPTQDLRGQRELQNTYFTKWVPFHSWFAEQQRIQKQGGKILSVDLAVGRQQTNTGN